MSKKYTILVIPEGTHHVKRFMVHSLLFPLAIIVLVGSLGLAGYWYSAYRNLGQDLPNMQYLTQQTKRQEAQLNELTEKIALFKDQMHKVKTFNQQLKVLANLQTPEEAEAFLGIGGPESPSGPGIKLTASAQERQMAAMQRDLDLLDMESEAELVIQEELASFLHERRSILASTPSIWPTRGWVTSSFGYRVSPWTGKKRMHSGIDVATRQGSPVIAPANGVITFAGVEGSYGNLIIVNHGHGLVTRYGHLHEIKVKVGQKVERGQLIGTVGSTGRSTGSHLHYEVLLSGIPTNPRYYLLD